MRRILPHIILLLIACFSISANVYPQPFYVALNGSDSNSGTIGSPFLTIEKAVSRVQPGQTIYVRCWQRGKSWWLKTVPNWGRRWR
jgi:hypothetical protein